MCVRRERGEGEGLTTACARDEGGRELIGQLAAEEAAGGRCMTERASAGLYRRRRRATWGTRSLGPAAAV